MLARAVDEVRASAGLRVTRAESAVRQYIAQGMFDPAREALGSLQVEGMPVLGIRITASLAMLEGAEKAKAEAEKAKLMAGAEIVYLALCGKVNGALGKLDCDEARKHLRMALVDGRLKLVRTWINEDMEHVAYVDDILAAAARGAQTLKGSNHSFKTRAGAAKQ